MVTNYLLLQTAQLKSILADIWKARKQQEKDKQIQTQAQY